MERGYKKLIRKQILSAREHSRNDLLEREKQQMSSEKKLKFRITYYRTFQNVRGIMEELHILLIHDKKHKKVFPNVSVVGFQNDNSLQDYLVREKLPKLEESSRCQLCVKKLAWSDIL